MAALATSEPSPIRDVATARAPSNVKHSSIVCPEKAAPERWSKVQTVENPASSAARTASRYSGHEQRAGLNWTSKITEERYRGRTRLQFCERGRVGSATLPLARRNCR